MKVRKYRGSIIESMLDNLERDAPIVDFGGHIVPKGYVQEFMKPLDQILDPMHNNPKLIHERYNEANIDRVVLSQPPYIGSGDRKIVAESNDVLLDIVQQYDDFYGLAAIPTASDGKTAAEELERCLQHSFNGRVLETIT